jgi:hypothetical protein
MTLTDFLKHPTIRIDKPMIGFYKNVFLHSLRIPDSINVVRGFLNYTLKNKINYLSGWGE